MNTASSISALTSLRYWARWIAVLPAALGAYVGIQILVAFISLLWTGLDDRPDYWSQFVNSVVAPYGLVLAGAYAAPGYRFITALTLTILHALMNAMVVALGFAFGVHEPSYMWFGVLASGGGLAATIGACIQVRRQSQSLERMMKD